MNYLKQAAIAFDQFINALLGGWADETLSARCHRESDKAFINLMRLVINAIFFWQLDHCKTAYQSEIGRRQLPPIYREG